MRCTFGGKKPTKEFGEFTPLGYTCASNIYVAHRQCMASCCYLLVINE